MSGAILNPEPRNRKKDNENDIYNSTVGRGRIIDPKYRFTVQKQNALIGSKLAIMGVRSWGTLKDLYDFNFDEGGETAAARKAATLQIGNGNGSYGYDRAHGIIYRTQTDFDKTYTEMP